MRIKKLHTSRISDEECPYKDEVFGKLTVQGYLNDKAKNGSRYVWCVCECGNRVKTLLTDIKNGRTKSCGCSRRKPIELSDKVKVGWQEMYYFQFLAYTKLSPKEVEERRMKGESLRDMYMAANPEDTKKLARIRKVKKRKQKNYHKPKTPKWQRSWRKKREQAKSEQHNPIS